MYISSILWLFTWPVIIILSYLFIRLALKKYEKLSKGKKSEKTEIES
jgi:hypothetical protein